MKTREDKMKTGMEPWFEFWEKVRYAIQEIRKEYRNRKECNREYKKWLLEKN